MTIVSDKENKTVLDKEVPSIVYKKPSNFRLLNWWKVTRPDDKFLSLLSLGFSDFRNDNSRPEKMYIDVVDKIIDIFEDNIDNVEIDTYNLKFAEYSIWIANKPYAMKVNVKHQSYGMTVNQIARVIAIETYLREKKTAETLKEIKQGMTEWI